MGTDESTYVELLSTQIKNFNACNSKVEFALIGSLYSEKTEKEMKRNKESDDSNIINSNCCRLYLSPLKYINVYIPSNLFESYFRNNHLRQRDTVKVIGYLQIFYTDNSITPVIQMYCNKVFYEYSASPTYIADLNNAPKKFPATLNKIAVISSNGSDGYDDFIDILSYKLKSKVKFYSVNFGTFNAVNEINFAIDMALVDGCDIICIVRGGGDSVGLRYVFDDRNLCDHIVKCSIPVYIGVGHTKDITNADRVSDAPLGKDRYFNTPSVLAQYINDAYENQCNIRMNNNQSTDLNKNGTASNTSSYSGEFNPVVDTILKILSVVIVFGIAYWLFFK